VSSDYRYEIKFALDNTRLADVMHWLYNNTSANKSYDNRMVNSIYFDDIDFSSMKDNLSGIAQRNKLRLRWYGNQKNSLPIFEVKTKNGKLGYKTAYPIKSIENNIMELALDNIVSKCIKDLATQDIIFDKHIVPTLHVNYEREYYETHESIRITIDQDIKFSDTQVNTTLNENNFFSYPFNVVEIKFEPSMKDKVAQLIKPLHITPKRHSKYLVGLAVLGYAVYI
jgi:SPX domain protein involved in polyphosphate accumulation